MIATTNTIHRDSYSSEAVQQLTHNHRESEEEAWLKLYEEVSQSKKRTDFTKEPLKVDDKLSFAQNYYRILFSLLIKAGMRELGQKSLEGMALADYLWLFVYQDAERQALAMLGVTEYGGADLKEAVFQCTRAAEKAIAQFDEDKYRKLQEKGRKAGQAYSTYTLDDYLETAHMTAKEASAHLGIKLRTVYNMRNKFKNINLETGEVDE
ncbi:hypothetical protein [Microbacterium sp. PRC9]|uniref:hypothetical protein n=1 Tax=Microbacterium sp. PRC9 TaxID=2962591 RepID=UPI0028816446|nr:hypothetical protein [Microbacterium sp. PRC9]MDT0142783.1 hypothetical protein [Microbacterium sp. PRC9]